MQNKIKYLLFAVLAAVFVMPAIAQEDDMWAEDISADAVAAYDVDGSLFQQITDLEQEKVLLQLEKERAQLDLELDRLAAEKIKLHMEIDTLSGRAEEQQAALEVERAKLEAEAAKLEREKNAAATAPVTTKRTAQVVEDSADPQISNKYRLVNIVGAGNQLQATLEDVDNGQRKKVSVGKDIDGFTIKSISLDDGVVFVKGDITETLSIGKGK